MIDEYGWIKPENFYVVDGGEYSNCLGSGWSSPCDLLDGIGAVFYAVRFNEETISGSGIFLVGDVMNAASHYLKNKFFLFSLKNIIFA